jgi:hypothetical protein
MFMGRVPLDQVTAVMVAGLVAPLGPGTKRQIRVKARKSEENEVCDHDLEMCDH